MFPKLRMNIIRIKIDKFICPIDFFFNASKPNVAILPCFEDNIKLLSSSLTEQYANKNSYFTNSPTECQTVCQVTDKCNYFTYNFKTNKCW